MYQDLVHEEQYKGLEIKLYLLPEYDDPDWDITEAELAAINSGDLLWFCAKVEASIDGHILGTDYLGGCCYESVADFIDGGNYVDMRDCVFEESCKEIEKLIKWSENHASNPN